MLKVQNFEMSFWQFHHCNYTLRIKISAGIEKVLWNQEPHNALNAFHNIFGQSTLKEFCRGFHLNAASPSNSIINSLYSKHS